MKAVRIYEHGGIDKLIYEDIPEPECQSGKIKIQVKATSINHLDIWVRYGLPGISSHLPMILGSDGSGTIEEIGEGITNFCKGDNVLIQPGTFCSKCLHCNIGKENYCLHYGILGETENGTQAEYILVDPINIYSKPDHLTYEEAASMPLVFMTAYQMIIKRANLQQDETVLIYGGSSGVGSAAIQISHELGAQVIATAGSEEKCDYSKSMGAHHAINHNKDSWLDEVKRITENKGVNVVIEHVGSATWDNSLRILSKGGRIVTCGATTGMDVRINLSHLFMKQHSILGSTMSDIQSFKEVMRKITDKIYIPLVDQIFNMEDVRLAHRYIEDRQQMGKIILIP